ncbi:MAG: hypothetical protein R3E79_21555 [Caldilineaceae bacterium]
MLIPNAVYRFNRTNHLTYYQAGRTSTGIDYLSPISVDGSEIISRHPSGRSYIILYFVAQSGTLAASGYWLDTVEPFAHVYDRCYCGGPGFGDRRYCDIARGRPPAG